MRFEDQAPLSLFPIGRVRSPYLEKMMAPRQGSLSKGVLSEIVLFDDPRLEHALDGIESWSHLWVIFWFDRDPHFSPKVQPPRSAERRGVFATRSPHRPNPIGLTAARLVRREGTSLWLDGLDLLDDTCVLDLKPYVPYADRLEEANDGWLEVSSAGDWALCWSDVTLEQLAFLEAVGVHLRRRLEQIFEAGPFAHPSRRIRREGSRGVLALKDFRVCFEVADRRIELVRIESGEKELSSAPLIGSSAPLIGSSAPLIGSSAPLIGSSAPPIGSSAPPSGSVASTPIEVHRAFAARFGRRDPEDWLKGSHVSTATRQVSSR